MANLDFFALLFIPLTLVALLIFTGNRMRLYFLELRHRTAADSYDYKMHEWEQHQERMAAREEAARASQRTAAQVARGGDDSASYSYSYTSVSTSGTAGS